METSTTKLTDGEQTRPLEKDEKANGADTPKEEPSADEKSEDENGEKHSLKPVVFPILAILLGAAIIAVGIIAYVNRDHATPKPILRLYASESVGRELTEDLAKEFLKHIEGQTDDPVITTVGEARQFSFPSSQGTKIVEVRILKDSHAAFETLAAGSCDVGLFWRQLNYGEKTNIKSANQEAAPPSEFLFANAGVAVIVNSDNPVRLLSKDEVKKIFMGDIDHWGQFKSMVKDIKVFALDDDSEIYGPLKKLLTGTERITYKAERFKDSSQVMAKVAAVREGIGLVDVRSIKDTDAVRQITVREDGETASGADAATDPRCSSYLFCQPLYMYVWKANKGYTFEFQKFIFSDEGSRILNKHNLLAAASNRGAVTQYGPECDQAIKGARKVLHFTCQFGSGSSELGKDAQRSIQEVMKSLKDGGYRLIILGFADDNGDIPFNKQLSENRAGRVWEMFNAEGVEAVHKGCGQVPSGSSEDEKSKNRRVEIWFKE